MRFFPAALTFLVLVAGCSNQPEKPENLLPEKTYIDLLVELQILSTYQKREQPDSTTVDSLRHRVFEKYGATELQFRESHAYYQQNLDQQEERIKKAIESLRKDQMAKPDSTAKDTTKKN